MSELTTKQNQWIDRFVKGLEGIQFFSAGSSCEGCSVCCDNGMADEGSFSWRACDVCGCGLGGDRYPCHGFIAESEEEARSMADRDIWHGNVCQSCVLFHCNGDVPDDEHL